MKKLTLTLYLIGGTLAVFLGIIGMFLPILPTTPFLLLAAFCYARSSKRFYDGLLNNRWFGEYIRNYREGKGIPLRQKVLTLLLLWLTIGNTILFLAPQLWIRILLLLIASGVTIHLVRMKTFRPKV
ncbi:MAG: DUF454 domain-containing protein [Calditrichaeota bacterium]|nr:MAG: DUF454 domain-containing protein [Calditrichota bacterium]